MSVVGPSAHNGQLDGLRGYAAVAVAFFHTILAFDETMIPRIVYGDFASLPDLYSVFAKVVLRLLSGETAVFIFFVLSGAVLFRSLARDTAPFPQLALTFSLRRI